jgi:hypothetical protein
LRRPPRWLATALARRAIDDALACAPLVRLNRLATALARRAIDAALAWAPLVRLSRLATALARWATFELA